ncbi:MULTISPECIES: prolyl oligopeptidase family serine peptidase [Stenotrophomonas]|uniref:carboxylesterase family protein n=1 Tax=Stenotrophomonas TaxID=40323 RepID=UPI000B679580|nr:MULTISPECIES: prolyl oligopeptidase family serine peptidase [Stenotrophomonas]SMR70413.1 Alpha/beta hydrolase family protein [Stenotrophomonas sp. yr243]SNT52307.1 Prolyl oligopeptidase family protein [Stenotrophomonas lactitubi]
MLRSFSRWLPLLALLMMTGCVSTPPGTRGHFEARAVKVDGETAYYQVFIPAAAVRTAGPLPVVLFLHGSGERGGDGVKQTHAGLGSYLRQHAADFPALAVFPQVPGREEWSGRNNRVAIAALDATIAEFGADPARQYLTGMSMGGYGSWNIALDDPQRFAAIVPICGAVLAPRAVRPTLFVEQVTNEADPYAVIAKRLQRTPIWIFHGALDDVVPPDDDRRLHAAFQSAGAHDVRYTEYPDGNHNAWDATYADAAMWAWLFKQKR